MTPFGIRKKLKTLLGGGASQPDVQPRPSFEVRITAPNGSEYTVQGKEGETLVTVSGRGAYPIMTGCAEGDCGTCRVEILTGSEAVSPAGDRERRALEANTVPEGWRLGCQARLVGEGLHMRVIDPFAEGFAS